MGTALNIIQEDSIWCTVRTSVDLKEYPTLLLTRYGQAVWCRTLQESSEETAPDPVLAAAPSRKLPSRHVMQRLSPGLTSPSLHTSSTETETELLMDTLDKCVKLPSDPGTAKECVCPVCDIVIFSGLALIHHLQSQHPDSRSYVCDQCGSSFNTTKNLSSHISLIHREPEVKCHFCAYCTMSRAQMHHHVHTHTKGERYTLYKKSFPIVKALKQQVIECSLIVTDVIELFLLLHHWPCIFMASMGKAMFVKGVKLDLTPQFNRKNTNAKVNSYP